jgi:phosphopantetheinyl transferase
LAFAAVEIDLLPATNRDEWVTRCWCAKEAVGKARGTGLAGNPKSLAITAIEQERVCVDGRWVATRKLANHIIGWTEQ